jgi:hypothetical protein
VPCWSTAAVLERAITVDRCQETLYRAIMTIQGRLGRDTPEFHAPVPCDGSRSWPLHERSLPATTGTICRFRDVRSLCRDARERDARGHDPVLRLYARAARAGARAAPRHPRSPGPGAPGPGPPVGWGHDVIGGIVLAESDVASRPAGAELRQLRSRGRLRGVAALLGPAFVAAIAYVDPGNFATNFSAGRPSPTASPGSSWPPT